MLEPPPPESYASMWPVLDTAASYGLERAQREAVERERMRRAGLGERGDVYRFFATAGAHHQTGHSVAECFQVFSDMGSGLGMQGIQAAVDSLTNEGWLYSTIDDEHFLATDPGANPSF